MHRYFHTLPRASNQLLNVAKNKTTNEWSLLVCVTCANALTARNGYGTEVTFADTQCKQIYIYANSILDRGAMRERQAVMRFVIIYIYTSGWCCQQHTQQQRVLHTCPKECHHHNHNVSLKRMPLCILRVAVLECDDNDVEVCCFDFKHNNQLLLLSHIYVVVGKPVAH